MKTKSAVLLMVMMASQGCSMSNDKIISETKKCNDAGMKAEPTRSVLTFKIVDITCTPRETK